MHFGATSILGIFNDGFSYDVFSNAGFSNDGFHPKMSIDGGEGSAEQAAVLRYNSDKVKKQ